MKVLSKIIAGLVLLHLLGSLCGCITKPIGQFTEQDFMLIKPFVKKDTVVYASKIGERDTVIFFPAEIDTVERRSFELGFYNAYVMGVEYDLTHGSYHVQKDTHNGMVLYNGVPERLYAVNISTKEFSGRELSFFGLVFNGEELKKVLADRGLIFFNGESKNNSRGINSFKFSTDVGIVSYVDTGGNEWVRVTR